MTATTARVGTEVREAVRADLLEVFRIEKRSFAQPWPYAAFEGFLGEPGFLVADDEGVGRLLLGEALGTLAVDGADRVKLEVRATNGAARSLYREFDFETHHVVPAYYDDGEDAHIMIREA
ncbi:ribosomal-protein-alanine N-acetyltransferase RimI [Halobacteriales archaeon QS_9_70_65]|nr:MAG: ribosomal-protein-alanine N-acetyltransferase RimI [Halobacteriales archaeon QS_9_70_65]